MAYNAMLDPILRDIPGLGGYLREQQPDVALEEWLSRIYIPPKLKQLLRASLPRLLRQSLLQQSQQLDAPGGLMNLPYMPFQVYLRGLDPFAILRGMQSESGTSAAQQAVTGKPLLAGTSAGARQRVY